MADGIPYPQGPTYNIPNPLQQMEQMQGMALRQAELQKMQQATQQQELSFNAKQSLGAIMQKHFDPKTGEFNHVEAFGDLASHPELSPVMADYMPQLLQMPGTQAEALRKQLEYKEKQFAVNSQISADGVAQLQVPNVDPKSVATSVIAKMASAGSIPKDQIPMFTAQMVNYAKTDPKGFAQLLYKNSQFGKDAQESLRATGMQLGQLTEQVETFDQDPLSKTFGQKIFVPRYAAGGMSPGVNAVFGGRQNVEAGGVAPPAGGSARQEGLPSAPPAARLAEPPLASTQLRDYMSDTEGTKHWLRKEETSAQEEANSAMRIENNLHKQEEVLRQFEQGPLMEARVKIAEYMRGVGMPESMVKSFLGEVKGAKDALGAAQLARKYFFEGAANELKTSLPGLQKATNFDVQTALKASPEMGMTKEGINQYMRNVQNIMDMAKERADFAGRYGRWSVNAPAHERAFSPSVYGESLRDWLEHKGLIKTGPIDVTKKPGEK